MPKLGSRGGAQTTSLLVGMQRIAAAVPVSTAPAMSTTAAAAMSATATSVARARR